jgi:hypothetical protein
VFDSGAKSYRPKIDGCQNAPAGPSALTMVASKNGPKRLGKKKEGFHEYEWAF